MKIVITGISGFAGRHFVEFLAATGEQHSVVGIYFRNKPAFSETQFPNVDCSFHQVNLMHAEKLSAILSEFQPGYILHLASKSSVAYSWQHPAESITENNTIFLNLVEQVRLLGLKCRLLSVGSSEEYGNVAESRLPLTEEQSPSAINPYGASRIFQQVLGDIYCLNYDIDIVHTRSFNHIGPYQSEDFVVSSFTRQLAIQLRKGRSKIVLSVGDVDVVRDFTDVRDVVKAYYLLLLKGKKGGIYNVCSNKGFILKDIIYKLGELTGTEISWEINQNNFRPSENKKIIGSYARIKKEIGWEPVIPIEKSLRDLMQYWMQKAEVLHAS